MKSDGVVGGWKPLVPLLAGLALSVPVLAVVDEPPAVQDATATVEVATGVDLSAPAPSLGRKRFNEGELASAEVAVKQALRENAFDQEALLLLADLRLARYDASAAEFTLRRALDARVPMERVAVPLAKALNQLGRYQAVLDELEPTRAMDAASRANLLAERARAQVGLGNADVAERLLDDAVAASPNQSAPYLGKAVLALRGGRPDAARALIDTALAKAPNDLDAWLFLGQLERRQGGADAAETAFGEAVARSPVRWLAAYWRALVRLERNDLPGAEADIALAATQFPDFAGLNYLRGRVRLLQDRPLDALELLERYLGSLPRDPNGLFYAAFASNQLGNHKQALEYLSRMQVVEPNSVRWRWLQAKTLLAQGEPEAVIALLQGSMAASPPATELARELVLLMQQALRQSSRDDEARALLQRALETATEDNGLATASAALDLAAGDLAAAERTARAVLERDAEDVDARLIAAEAALLAGKPVDAVDLAQLRMAEQRRPADARLPTLRAALLGARGDDQAACDILFSALPLAPDAPLVRDRLSSLNCAELDPDGLHDAWASAGQPSSPIGNPSASGAAGTEIEGLQAQLAAAPKDMERRFALVDALLRQRRVDEALAVIQDAPPQQARQPTLLRARAVTLMAAGDWDAAVNVLAKLLLVAPDSAEANYLQADAQARTGDVDKGRFYLLEGWRRDAALPLGAMVAASVFAADPDPARRRRLVEDLRRLSPDAPVLAPLDVELALDAGDTQRAVGLLAKQLKSRPNDSATFRRLVAVLLDADRLDEVLAVAEPWVARHPQDIEALRVIADIHASAGRLSQAEDGYRRVLALDPDNVYALNELALLLTASDPKAASKFAGRAYALAPKEPQVLDTYAAALLALGEPEQARELLTAAYGMRSTDPAIGYNFARALVATGQPELARKVLTSLLTGDSAASAFSRRADAEALLRRLDKQ